ncbi:hypothetical protein BH10CYA1_BH10CYA1_45500 [soil metagenome]
MKKNTKNITVSTSDQPKWTSLTDKQVARLNKVNAAYTAELLATRPVYPELPVQSLTDILLGNTTALSAVGGLEAITQLGWSDHQLDITLDDLQDYRGGRRRGNRGGGQQQRSRGGSKGGSSKGGGRTGGGTLLNPAIVLASIKTKIASTGLKPVGMTGKLVHGAQNFEMLTQAKAKWFGDSYKEFIPLAHVWICVEIGKDGLEEIARQTGYTAYCSADNSRGNQAVGILVHPRLKVLGQTIIQEVADVQGVGDLRPVLVLELEDTSPDADPKDKTFKAAAVHLKSMRGGEATTAAVRYQQCQIIANKLTGKVLIGGDWNMKLPGIKDYSPMTAAGWLLVDAGDSRNTHIMGSRLDAFFTLTFITQLKGIKLLDWFSDATIGRGLTDHAGIAV